MDIFNRKRVKYLEEQLKLTSTKEARARGIVKFLIEEPDSYTSIEIRRVLTDRYKKSIWSSLTKEAHLGWLYDEETTKRFVKELVEYI